MFIKILKKDLKRKKTMNIILLLFIIMATMFISSSVNNIITITKALDVFFEKAGVANYILLNDENLEKETKDFLDQSKNVNRYFTDEVLMIAEKDITFLENKKYKSSKQMIVTDINCRHSKFFDDKNQLLKVNDGEVYLENKDMVENKIQPGDIIIVNQMQFKVMGNMKDAMLGSSMMGANRMLISDNDYKKLKQNQDFSKQILYSIDVTDGDTFLREFDASGIQCFFNCGIELLKLSYVMDTIIAGILIVVSICLIAIAMVILRFTILFTLQEEFREIGIMKAIGIKNRKIRSLYITKYLAISLVGAICGFFVSIPFSNVLMKNISQNILITSSQYGYLVHFGCSAMVVLIVLLFSYSCTRQVNKFSSIDAIRCGSNGERFKKKGFLRLAKCGKISPPFFMAVNDILSGLKRFGVLILTFTLGTILMIIPINTINTLSDENTITMFDMKKSDLYVALDTIKNPYVKMGNKETIEAELKKAENSLAGKGIHASIWAEAVWSSQVKHENESVKSLAFQAVNTDMNGYELIEGSLPQYDNEVMMTRVTANVIHAGIGDTVTITTGNIEKKYIITAFYQTMSNMGEGVRFMNKADLDYASLFGVFGLQVKFIDQVPSGKMDQYKKEVKALYPENEVYNGTEYLATMIGDVVKRLEGIKWMILLIIILINMLVAVLMVKSFITKETGEIGMLKSIGFNDSSIIKWQTFRIGLILLISTILGAILSDPISQISTQKIFQMMGADQIRFVIKPLEVFVLYPLFIFAATILASVVTALQVKKISASETNNIE